ncbi:MAG: hypothetical protein RJA70_590 [Pseudomonadota bacterium]|jgi:RNA polymerase sigma-70 factor (ECF subfamily)
MPTTALPSNAASAAETAVGARSLVDHFFRHEYGRLVSRLVRRFGTSMLERVEDAVQSALAQALVSWTLKDLPENPAAWLTRAAENQLRDQLRRGGTQRRASEFLVAEQPKESEPSHVRLSTEIADDELCMLFVCADPGLPLKTQLVLALKLLCGFSTSEIAARLFMTDANVQKTLVRGRERLRTAWQGSQTTDWQSPGVDSLPARRGAVQQVIYLLFTEGYSSQKADEVIRRELAEEALRLGELLVRQPVGDTPDSWALLALLHFHIGRFDARVGSEGELLLLDQQDRSLWDRCHIARGYECLWRSGQGESFSRYHGEAAIAAEHCRAASFHETRWSEIVELYGILEKLAPSPLYTLNRAIALAEWKGPQEALRVLEPLVPPGWLAGYYLWGATLGELQRRAGEFETAEVRLARAVDLAPTDREKAIFNARLARCRARDAGTESDRDGAHRRAAFIAEGD